MTLGETLSETRFLRGIVIYAQTLRISLSSMFTNGMKIFSGRCFIADVHLSLSSICIYIYIRVCQKQFFVPENLSIV